jgi:hypothetical protein
MVKLYGPNAKLVEGTVISDDPLKYNEVGGYFVQAVEKAGDPRWTVTGVFCGDQSRMVEPTG